MTDENALVQILEREGIMEFLQSKKGQLWDMFCAFKYAHQIIFPPENGKENCLDAEVICPLIWSNLRWALKIQNMFVTHSGQFNMEELEKYGGPVSKAVVREVFKILEVDFGNVRLSGKASKP